MDSSKQKRGFVKGALGSVGKAVTDTVGGAMALPWTIAAHVKMAQDAQDAKALKRANQVPANVPQFDANGNPTSGFMAQTVADGVKQKLKKNKNASIAAGNPDTLTGTPIQKPSGLPTGGYNIQVGKPKLNKGSYLREQIESD